jgi:hypothetical protein
MSISISGIGLPSVLQKRQWLMISDKGRSAGIVVPLPQVATHPARRADLIAEPGRGLLTRKFRVGIRGAIGFRLFDCAFREYELQQTSGCPFAAWHVKNVAASFYV